MSSQMLKDAREYEAKVGNSVLEEERPRFHLSSRSGWMNDPNGFSYYKGEYHLFYQYFPYDNRWGPMHWAHAKSKDLIHWEYLPAALAPDTTADADGCFSGSAFELNDGRQALMYTGVNVTDEYKKYIQTQCVAVIDDNGEYVKYEGNPVLTSKDLPKGYSRYDFRDPKVFRQEDGTWACVICACKGKIDGRIVYYTSENGIDWTFKSVLAENNGRYGTIWECPDFFELDGKHALICSPMNMTKTPDKYNPGNGTLCLIGTFDQENTKLIEENDQPIDGGVDFYAPTTLIAPDGRRIMVAWMQNWESIAYGAKNFAWFGQMTIPRELHIKDNHLIQNPVREIENYWGNETLYRDVPISEKMTLDGISGRMLDMTVNVRADSEDAYGLFEIHVASDDNLYTSIRYKRKDHFVTVDRRYSGIRNAVISKRSMKVKDLGGDIKLRIILDRYSVEVFINDGEQALSTVIYTDLSADTISFMADGKAIVDIDKHDLVMNQ
jgi:beta-fructofuranosidase